MLSVPPTWGDRLSVSFGMGSGPGRRASVPSGETEKMPYPNAVLLGVAKALRTCKISTSVDISGG
jgi:hypothetical protein